MEYFVRFNNSDGLATGVCVFVRRLLLMSDNEGFKIQW